MTTSRQSEDKDDKEQKLAKLAQEVADKLKKLEIDNSLPANSGDIVDGLKSPVSFNVSNAGSRNDNNPQNIAHTDDHDHAMISRFANAGKPLEKFRGAGDEDIDAMNEKLTGGKSGTWDIDASPADDSVPHSLNVSRSGSPQPMSPRYPKQLNSPQSNHLQVPAGSRRGSVQTDHHAIPAGSTAGVNNQQSSNIPAASTALPVDEKSKQQPEPLKRVVTAPVGASAATANPSPQVNRRVVDADNRPAQSKQGFMQVSPPAPPVPKQNAFMRFFSRCFSHVEEDDAKSDKYKKLANKK